MIDPKILESIIKKRGLKRKDLAKELGISEAALSMKMNGKRSWSLSQAVKLAKFLKLNAKERQAVFKS